MNSKCNPIPSSASATTINSMASSPPPPLLREWSYTAPTTGPQESSPPVAPAVVLMAHAASPPKATSSSNTSTPQQQQYSYPVATFVSNLIQHGLDHIYTGVAETIPVSSSTPQITIPSQGSHGEGEIHLSVRSEDLNSLRRMTFAQPGGISGRSAATEGATPRFQDDFEDAQFVIIDGDLVAMPAPPPNQEEMEEYEYNSRQSGRAQHRPLRKLRKWFKKRATGRNTQQEDGISGTSSRSSYCASGEDRIHNNKRNKRKTRRRSWTGTTSSPVPNVPPMVPITEVSASTSSAVSAHFIGNVGIVSDPPLLDAGVLPAADVFIESEASYDKIDTVFPTVTADKVDVESMLYLARQVSDLEQSTDTVMDAATVKQMLHDVETASSHSKPQARSNVDGRPLSSAGTFDHEKGVFNDTLKIVMVGDSIQKSNLALALRNSSKRNRRKVALGVDVHTWTHSNVKFSIWDVHGAAANYHARTSGNDDSSHANAGAHSSTQSLFFSPNSLYVLVWDLAAANVKTRRRNHTIDDDDDDDDDEGNEFLMEEANRLADAALEADIYERVLRWIDCIPGNGSAILPVVTIPHDMDEIEVKRRCCVMQGMLMRQLQDRHDPKLIFGNESILRVDLDHGVEELQATIVAIATDKRERVFDHVGSPVSSTTAEVLEILRRLSQDHRVILLDHILSEMNVLCNVQEVIDSLQFLASIGECLYFGSTDSKDDVLSRYIILKRKWLVSALSCILRSDLKRELAETRRFMNMQCFYSDQAFPENKFRKTLLSGANSSCPILSSTDSAMLWQSMTFMREAADRSSHTFEAATPSTMYEFLERLLVRKGVFLPLNVSSEDDSNPTYFVPSLLAQGEPSDVWTYKSSESWMTTLCHSWLLRDGAPTSLMERVSVSLMQDLYEFAHSVPASPARLGHSRSFPMGHSSLTDFMDSHESVGRIKIHHIMCWKSSVLVKIGCVFADPTSCEIRESFAEIFVSLVDPQCPHSVASSSIGSGMMRLVTCGKGPAGDHGRKLWKTGYGVVLDSIKSTLADLSNVDRHVVCPECLAHSHPSVASIWGWDDVRALMHTGNTNLLCMRGHRVDTDLLCGTCKDKSQSAVVAPPLAGPRVSSMLRSVVLVGLWDEDNQCIRSAGSGFVVNEKHGLIITAGHILFDMLAEGPRFGQPRFGLENWKAVIGVISDDSHVARFRYFAEVVAHDISNIDACVLRITSKMNQDVEGEGEDCANQSEISLSHDLEAIETENLQHLKFARRFELEEAVRILGFNQGGEGLLEEGQHINRSADFAKGYICKTFTAAWDDSSSESSSCASFSPREEIVVMCKTIGGHSGGPCVNDEGRVVGILSRADPVDRERCYLVPASELKVLVSKAKETCRSQSERSN